MSIVVPMAYAAGVEPILREYRAIFCGDPNNPWWLCGIAGPSGAKDFLGKIVAYIVGIAAAIGVCVFIYACIRMIMSQGQEDKVSAAKKMATIALVGVFLVLSANMLIRVLWSEAPVGPQTPSILRTIFGLPS